MLLVTGEIQAWSEVIVALLMGGDESLVLQCFVQMLEARSLIDPKPISIDKHLLAHRGNGEWVHAVRASARSSPRAAPLSPMRAPLRG